MLSALTCPLCHSPHPEAFFSDKRRHYLRCNTCQLVFVPPEQLLGLQEEREIYDLHENNAEDPGYQRFLNRLAIPLNAKLGDSGKQGIDFGCGNDSALPKLISSHGHHVSLYDPYYFPAQDVLQKRYDFIACSEAIEHFHHPAKTWQLWCKMLKPDGVIGIMTKRWLSRARFSTWHYKNDVTHVNFYHEETFQWIAETFHLNLTICGPDVVMLQAYPC